MPSIGEGTVLVRTVCDTQTGDGILTELSLNAVSEVAHLPLELLTFGYEEGGILMIESRRPEVKHGRRSS